MDVVKDAIGHDDQMPAMYNYDEGTFVAIIAAGDEGNRNVVMYPCRGHRQMNFACAVPDTSLRNPSQLEYSWNAKGSADELLEGIQGFPEWLKRVFRRVRDQEPLPTYVKGRTMLIGDAAHAMVPYQGQGANQALEDVEGLDVLLADVTDRDGIPGLLCTWDSVRRPRASEIQRSSRASQAKIASRSASDAILSVKPYMSIKEAVAQLQGQQSGKIVA
ncbi:Salicylate hydroxylase [Lasiodiplodia theobromae]|uniref:Salicylate hydroxylase n=1 Tax=Lasiodiplodia theobromae TaxID=45133 RepID=A0A5N5D6Y1_9PEZI|nr:Salicylate hydroxylase [Lasiodiplodia theobromae]